MCMGGSSSPSKPPQPYRSDPEVQKYYTGPSGGTQYATNDGKGGITVKTKNSSSEWDAWEEAYYKYQKDVTQSQMSEQMAMQHGFMAQQADMQKQQMQLQKELQAQQMAAQARLQEMQQAMQEQAIAAQKAMEEQRLVFERDASLMQRDSQRRMDTMDDKSQQQARFQAGRDARNRKNPGNTMSSRGTKALQIGLNTGDSGTAGLAIAG